MIIVKILGGLGNQMFQYAFGYSIAKYKKDTLKLDIGGFETYALRTYELDRLNISKALASLEEVESLKYRDEGLLDKVIRRAKRKPKPFSMFYYKEHYFHFDKNVFRIGHNAYFEGYWQSEKYFLDYRQELLDLFSLKDPIHLHTQQYKKQIKDANSVSLHIRRGDYVTNNHTNSVHGTCDLDYYKKAISFIQGKFKNVHFFIFSDDLNWAKEHLKFIERITFVELDKEVPDHEEMYLMSQCQHNIIANSSFSWWGAWLNQNPDKIVIAPKKWFSVDLFDTKDLLPSSWMVL